MSPTLPIQLMDHSKEKSLHATKNTEFLELEFYIMGKKIPKTSSMFEISQRNLNVTAYPIN